MPRRPRRRSREPDRGTPSPLSGGWLRHEGDWVVRSISGAAATKGYRCPGCSQEIGVGVPHVVAWRADEPTGGEERRHWHTACWRRAS